MAESIVKIKNGDIEIDTSQIAEIVGTIPAEDFVHEQFDTAAVTATTDILFLLSTPRCGSTFLSDLVRLSDLCLPHEYFQPFQYLPMLAARWGCIEDGALNKQKFIEKLLIFRTHPSGWIGVNLHGHHLQAFSCFSGLLPNLREHYIHLKRRDVIAQAVSYEIASQTGKWSSHFQSSVDTHYSYEGIQKKIQIIEEMNLMIAAYVRQRRVCCITIYYEDLVREPGAALGQILAEGSVHLSLPASDLDAQSNALNVEWARRFSEERSKGAGIS
jgi:LPS sulfotransferase NodH